jgi:hypothetical protein
MHPLLPAEYLIDKTGGEALAFENARDDEECQTDNEEEWGEDEVGVGLFIAGLEV